MSIISIILNAIAIVFILRAIGSCFIKFYCDRIITTFPTHLCNKARKVLNKMPRDTSMTVAYHRVDPTKALYEMHHVCEHSYLNIIFGVTKFDAVNTAMRKARADRKIIVSQLDEEFDSVCVDRYIMTGNPLE